MVVGRLVLALLFVDGVAAAAVATSSETTDALQPAGNGTALVAPSDSHSKATMQNVAAVLPTGNASAGSAPAKLLDATCPSYVGAQKDATTGEYLYVTPVTDAAISNWNVYVPKPEYKACGSSCGYSRGGGVTAFSYDYRWNKAVSSKAFWEDTAKGWQKAVPWWQPGKLACKAPYVKESWGNSKCVLPGDMKFLGDPCTKKSQCAVDPLPKYVDTTCAPTKNDAANPDWRCVLDEESNAVSPYASTCSCFGIISCASDDCNGNQCVLSTRDMKKHCKYADEPMFTFLGGGSCSNCPHATGDSACKAYA